VSFHENWTEKPLRVFLLFVFCCLILGAVSFSIPLGYLPKFFRKTVQIIVEYRGAFEQEIERMIVDPLEDGLCRIEGVKEIFSLAEREKATLTVTFYSDRSLDRSYLEVREVVSAVSMLFPESVQRPIIVKNDPRAGPVFIAGFCSSIGIRERDLKRRYENVKGSGEIEISGASKPEITILFDPQKLLLADLNIEDLIRALRDSNTAGGIGRVAEIQVAMDNRFTSVDQLGSLSLGSGLQLRDVAEVQISSRSPDSISRVNGRERIIVTVRASGDANALALCNRLERLTGSIADGEVIYSYGQLVEKALLQILYALLAGIALVVLLTFLFMGKLHLALLGSVNIPFSVLFAVAALRLFGRELNVLTLAGIAIGIGLVIDAGIVFIEAYRHSGYRYRSAINLARSPVLFSAATTVAVFVPLLFASPILVDQFGGLALAVSGSVVASCIYMFLFLPAFLHRVDSCCRKQAEKQKAEKSLFDRDGMLSRLLARLFSILQRLRWIVVLFLAVCVSTTVLLTLRLDRRLSFRDGTQAKIVRFTAEYPSGRTREFVFRSASPLEEIITSLPGVMRVSSCYKRERASFHVTLAEGADRDDVLRAIRSCEKTCGEAFLYFPEQTIGREAFSVEIKGPDIYELRRVARMLAEEIGKLSGVEAIIYHFKQALPAKTLNLQLEQIACGGSDPGTLYTEMVWALSSPVADKWRSDAGEMDIRLTALKPGGELPRLSDLLSLPLGGSWASSLPIGTVVLSEQREQTGGIYHLNRRRVVSFSVFTTRMQKAELLRATRELVACFPFTREYRAEVGRIEKEQGKITGEVAASLGLAVLLIFFILMFEFESLAIPTIVLAQIPLSFIFPLLSLKLFSLPISYPVMIGLVMTSGIAVNNSILVFAGIGQGPLTSKRLFTAFSRKLRPLVVSSLTTVAGVLPLMFSGKLNQGILAPLASTIALGILGSLGALFLTLPVVAKITIRADR